MNGNLKLSFKPAAILPLLQKAQSAIVGLFLVGAFGYTAWVVNAALNVEPAADVNSGTPITINFDKNTLKAIEQLDQVAGAVPVPDIGKDDPFRR